MCCVAQADPPRPEMRGLCTLSTLSWRCPSSSLGLPDTQVFLDCDRAMATGSAPVVLFPQRGGVRTVLQAPPMTEFSVSTGRHLLFLLSRSPTRRAGHLIARS